MKDNILAALESLGVTPRQTPRGLVASMRMGVMKREAVIDLDAFVETLPQGDTRTIAQNAARGILAVINEPGNSTAASMSFIDTTPSISPAAEGPGFAEGVAAAGGGAPFFQPYVGELQLAYYIDLDDGQRLLTQQQVDDWGVHPERVEKAGLSILFHRSGYERWENHLIEGVLIHRMAIGDGGDAARATLIEMFDYAKAQAGRLFALPSSGTLLFTDTTDEAALRVLKKVARGAFEKASDPLCRDIFVCREGKLVREAIAQI